MMNARMMPMVVVGLGLACNGGDKDSAGTDSGHDHSGHDTDSDTDSDTDGGTDTDTDGGGGWTLTGTVVDLATSAVVADGTCVRLLDPTPVVTGGESEILGDATTTSGAFSISDVVTSSALGLLMSVSSCDEDATDPYPTNTGILANEYSDLGDGDTLADKTAYSLSRAFMDGLDASATAAGYAGTVSEDGLMLGFVFDSAGAPVEGATISCGGCTVYYFDGDDSDGLFSTGTDANASTLASGNSMFAIPAASITSYSPDDGGAHTWSSNVVGSNPGVAVVVAFYAN